MRYLFLVSLFFLIGCKSDLQGFGEKYEEWLKEKQKNEKTKKNN